MQAFLDFLPVIAFVAAYWLTDFETAILVIMVAVGIQVILSWLVFRTLNKMHLASAGLVIVLGGGSLLLGNKDIFMWKPTVLNWIFALVFLASQYIGAKPIIRRILESASGEGEFQLSDPDWNRLNLMWVWFFLVCGAANIFVAYTFPEHIWVNFKLFGLLGLTLVFVIYQGWWISRRLPQTDAPSVD